MYRSQTLLIFIFGFMVSVAQNKLQNKIPINQIETISINGNRIFKISVSTFNTDEISIASTLDGEYQNNFQVVTEEENKTLNLSLGRLSFEEIPDDKRNAHKVVAATLHLKIPEGLTLHIKSDIGSVDLDGDFNLLQIELLQGHCSVKGNVKRGTINTIDGDINILTKSVNVQANSNHGDVILSKFLSSNSIWNLKSINGDITVGKLD